MCACVAVYISSAGVLRRQPVGFLFSDNKAVEASGRLQVLDPGDLLIAAVKESDAGLYTCVRANEAGDVHASAYLTVLGEGKARNFLM